MQTFHFKRLTVGGMSRDLMIEAVRACAWYGKGCKRGFSIHTADAREITGAYVWRETATLKTLDEESLEEKETSKEVLCKTVFRVLFNKGLMRVDKRGNFKVLYGVFDEVPNLNFSLEDLNINLEQFCFELQGAYKKNVIKSVAIDDYLARESMLTDATFKILEPNEGEKIVEKFSDQLDAVTLTLKLPDGPSSVKVTRKGTLAVSDDVPDELVMFMVDLLPRFDEREVEEVGVV